MSDSQRAAISAGLAKRRATFLLTSPHGSFDFATADLSELTLDDVAVSLSRLCRWRGAVPVSVAQHSAVMARCARSTNVARWCLMHDAHEMLVADVPSPLKRLRWMQPYTAMELRLQRAIAKRFDLCWPVPDEVHTLDRRALASEVREFLPHAEIPQVHGVHSLKIALAPAWSPAKAKREWLATASDLELT